MAKKKIDPLQAFLEQVPQGDSVIRARKDGDGVALSLGVPEFHIKGGVRSERCAVVTVTL